LRALGWFVLDLSAAGNGCPDLLAARGGRIALVEVKSKAGKLTPLQQALIDAGVPVVIARTADDVVNL
jgi:Holliday junction resolvase